jgi:WD40 repeat protein
MATREQHLLDLLERWHEGQQRGERLSVDELCASCPELAADLRRHIETTRRLDGIAGAREESSDATVAPLPTEAKAAEAGPEEKSPPTAEQTLVGGPPRNTGYTPPPLFPAITGYEVLEELGRGGMGVVYKAWQVRLNRIVALKMVLAGGHAAPEDRLRFLGEAEAIAAVKHPGIVQVYDFGTHDGLPFFSMEFCPGGSLAGKLAGTPLAAPEAARLVEQVARAVQAAHQKGIVHRDLKPANVLLTEDGQPKVTDFGLAKRVEAGAGLTTTGSVMGTPSYMAPEQAQASKQVGPAADVYALGTILYECLTGRPPFKAATPFDTLLLVVREEAASPRQLNPTVPRDLETICLKCLHKDPARRYASAGAVADELARYTAGEPILARPVGAVERAWRWCRRNPAVAISAAIVLLSLVAAAGVSLLFGIRAEQARQQEAARAISESEAREGEAARARGEAAAKQQAEQARRDAQRQLIDLCGSTGLAAAKEEDHSLALLWFARAVSLARGEPQQQELNRVRVANWLRHVFLPEGAFTLPGFRPMQDRFRTCRFSPDGNYVLALAYKGDCLVWDRRQGRLADLPDPVSRASAAAWQPGSGHLAVAGSDGRIRFLAPPGFRSVQELEGGEGITVLAFSGDGKRLAWGGTQGARVWDQEKKQYLTPLLVHPRRVTSLSLSTAGDLLATSASDLKARVFRVDADEKEPLFPPVPHAANFSGFNHGGPDRIAPRFAVEDSVLLTVDPSRGASGTAHTLICRTATTGKLMAPNASIRLGGILASFAVSPRGDRAVALWDRGRLFAVPPRGVVLAAIPTDSSPGRDSAYCEDAVFAANGRMIVTGGHNRLVRFWSVDNPVDFHLTASLPPIQHTHAVVGVALSPDGGCLAAALWSGTVCLWRLPQGPPRAYAIPAGSATLLALSPDRRLVLPRSTSYRGTRLLQTRVYHAESGEPAGPPLVPGGILIDAAFSPDGTRVVTASSAAETPEKRKPIIFERDGKAGNVQRWDWKSGKRLGAPIPTPGEPRGLAFRPDGGQLAVVCADYHVLLVDPSSGAITRTLDSGSRSRPNDANQLWGNGEARFSPDGRFLVTWAFAPAVHVWDPRTGRLLHTLRHNARVDRVAFHPARPTLMATGGRDSVVRIWDLESGQLISRLQHPFWIAGQLEFSPDGTELICGSDDMPRVWDWKAGQLKDALAHTSGPLMGFGFPANRRWLVGVNFKSLQLTDWRTKMPASPEYKLEGGPNLSLAIPLGERRAIVSGFSPSVVGYDLEALATPATAPAEELVRLAEVVASRRILSEGRVVPLTSAEWTERWQRVQRMDRSVLPRVPRAADRRR